MTFNNTANVIPYIICQKENLNDSQKKIADYIINDPSRIIHQTSKEVSETLNLSEATIVRFCQKLGFKGYRDFRIKLAQDHVADASQPVPEGISRDDSSLDVIKKVMQIECEDIKFTSNMLNENVILEVLDLISNCKNLAFFGVGSSALVASTAKEHFLHYGKPCFSESEGLSQIILANTLNPGDVAFAFSISGASLTPIKALEIATKRGAHTICMTQNISSPLAKLSEHIIQIYRKDQSIDDLGTATRIAHLSVIDALAVAYAARKWDQTTEIAKTNRANFRDYLYGH